MRKHKGDEHATLAAAADPKILKVLENIKDPDIERSLHCLSTPDDFSPMATTAFRTESRDRYTLTRLHAKGGIGQVWLARENDLGRDVALKKLQPPGAQYPELWANLLEEARLTSQMQHPGIVPVYELARRHENQPPFYTMRFVKGRTLREAIKAYHERRSSGKADVLDLRALLDAFVGVCNAVAYAHSRGVLHRDLKPQNVVLRDFGEAIVLDWGLGKVVDRPHIDLETPPVVTDPEESRERTYEGKVLGAPAYMSPEQAAGRIELVGQASDIYGLGAILYQILTDKPPSDGSTTAEILQKVRSESPKAPREVVADVSPALEAIFLRALAKEPTDRYASAELLGHEIKRWLADEPVLAYPEPVLMRAGRWARSHRTLVASAAVLLVTLVASLALGTWQNREARQMFEDLLALSMQNFEPRDPVRINAVNGLAWFLATVEQKELRDPKRAVQLSKGLAELLPEYGACWNSYGVAQYRAGDWKGAVESLTKSIDLSKGGDSNDFFFLAMANWQLGHKEEARKWYGKAVQWMDERQPKNPELVRFRAETEELMGMKKGGR
ncbi:MAG TPA: protein kinase [Gemmataceae bacterium]|nr:protein kinase [Gemmataceae bacterium]